LRAFFFAAIVDTEEKPVKENADFYCLQTLTLYIGLLYIPPLDAYWNAPSETPLDTASCYNEQMRETGGED